MKAKDAGTGMSASLEAELLALTPVLEALGYTLEEEQLHIGGERYLMSPTKLVLMGQSKDGKRVVIKAAHSKEGKAEMKGEKQARDLLAKLSFANDSLHMPAELHFGEHGEYLVFITEYIEQEKIFVDRPLEEQFFLTLRAFEAQEMFHASTYEHLREIRDVFKKVSAKEYIQEFASFKEETLTKCPDERLAAVLEKSESFLREHEATIDRYANHLTHTDFVPHNLRLHGRIIYLLDYAALCFANRHESWARFLNYMVVHNPALEKLLVEHLRSTRGADEYLSLRLMRVFKLGFLLRYYARSLEKTSGNLSELTRLRIMLWTQVLECILEDKEVPSTLIEEYIHTRNGLRSEEEKVRQREFAVA